MQALRVESVDWDHPDAVALRAAMEAEMVIRYADRLALRRVPRVQVEDGSVAHVAVVYAEDGQPVGHAALRWLDGELELKRMYVAPTHRGAGVSVALLCAIEAAAVALGGRRVILQTGDRQPDAVRLYEKLGYTPIPIYPPYEAQTYSLCFEKAIG